MNPDEESNLQEQRDEVLALQSIFNTDDEEKLKVISELSDDASDLYTLMVTIFVKPMKERIRIDIVLPEKQEELQGATAAPHDLRHLSSIQKNVQLNRTISEAHWTGFFEVKYLNPIWLYITFPSSYPSSESPSIHMTCNWLNEKQIQSLSAVLKKLWEEGCSMPIVYTWIDWLENNALDHLGIGDQLTIQVCDPDNQLEDDGEISDWQEEIGETIATLIQYNREQMDIEFCQNTHECEICFEEKQGTQFFRINDCNHKFCHECMMAYCEFHVGEGTVEELRCPDTKCNTLLPPYILQSVLDPIAYAKWEKLLLQKTLDSMSDTVYCPRCQSLVIAEEGELALAHCTVCFFTFCTECNRVWHQGTSCENDEAVIQHLTRNANALGKAEQKKLDEMLQKIREEAASKLELKQNVRNCPKCKIKVEKIGGCNKMTCKCSQIFCWICGKSIDGYSHFRNGSCALFPGQTPTAPLIHPRHEVPQAVLEMRARIAVNPALENSQCRCPSCKQLNLKLSSNNHMKCWNCKCNFCFLCKQKILKNISLHFQGPCAQHS